MAQENVQYQADLHRVRRDLARAQTRLHGYLEKDLSIQQCRREVRDANTKSADARADMAEMYRTIDILTARCASCPLDNTHTTHTHTHQVETNDSRVQGGGKTEEGTQLRRVQARA